MNHRTSQSASAPIGHQKADSASPHITAAHLALADALERIKRLEADLLECQEYFHDRMDVVDGDYGEPQPNREMRLHSMIDETLNGIPA